MMGITGGADINLSGSTDTGAHCDTDTKTQKAPVQQGPIVRAENDVTAVQVWLLEGGAAIGRADGMWGDRTTKAFEDRIKDIQNENGLEVTGTLDSATKDTIRKQYGAELEASLGRLEKQGVTNYQLSESDDPEVCDVPADGLTGAELKDLLPPESAIVEENPAAPGDMKQPPADIHVHPEDMPVKTVEVKPVVPEDVRVHPEDMPVKTVEVKPDSPDGIQIHPEDMPGMISSESLPYHLNKDGTVTMYLHGKTEDGQPADLAVVVQTDLDPGAGLTEEQAAIISSTQEGLEQNFIRHQLDGVTSQMLKNGQGYEISAEVHRLAAAVLEGRGDEAGFGDVEPIDASERPDIEVIKTDDNTATMSVNLSYGLY